MLRDLLEEDRLLADVHLMHGIEDPRLDAVGPGHRGEGPHVLGKATAAEAHARKEEGEADAAVVADAAADVVDVRPVRSQMLAISLMKLIFVESMALATYLVISALAGYMRNSGLPSAGKAGKGPSSPCVPRSRCGPRPRGPA